MLLLARHHAELSLGLDLGATFQSPDAVVGAPAHGEPQESAQWSY
jgi:hypothetical protein